MSKRITLAQATDTTEADVFGRVYELRPITRSVEEKLRAIGEEAGDKDIDDLDGDEFVGYVGRFLDALLKPLGPDNRTMASKALGDAWKGEKVTRGQVWEFLQELQRNGAGGEERPT